MAGSYQKALYSNNMLGSMSRPGTPTDNPKAERFMRTVKHEEIYALNYSSINDIKNRLPYFIEEIYNRRRIHSALNYVTPEEYEIKFAAQ